MHGISGLAYLGTHIERHNTALFKAQIWPCVSVCVCVEARLFAVLLRPCLSRERPCETQIIGHRCTYALCKHAQHTRLLHSLCGTDKRLKGAQRRFGLKLISLQCFPYMHGHISCHCHCLRNTYGCSI